MDFPKTCIEPKEAKDLAEFHGDSEYPELYIYDETATIAELEQKSFTVRAFIRRRGDPENIILPRIDVRKKLLIFRSVKDEDDLVIDGNEYEILCSKYNDQIEWYIE